MTLVSDRDRWGRQWSSLDSMAVSLKFRHPWLFHWNSNILRCLAVINVPSDQWFLCLTQIAEDGRGAIDDDGSSTKSLMINCVRDIFELIWNYAIEQKSPCSMKSRGTGSEVHLLNSSMKNCHPSFSGKKWHFDVYRKFNSPWKKALSPAPDDLTSSRAFSQTSGHKMNEKTVNKVFKIVDMSKKYYV